MIISRQYNPDTVLLCAELVKKINHSIDLIISMISDIELNPPKKMEAKKNH